MVYKRLKIVKKQIDRVCKIPLIKLHRLGVKPIYITYLSLPVGLFGVVSLFTGPAWGPIFVFLYLILDVLDGTMARVTDTVSEYGGKIDFIFDRIIAISFLIGLYLSGIEPAFAIFAGLMIVIVSLDELKFKTKKH